MESSKNEHDLWLEKIENAMRSFRSAGFDKAAQEPTQSPQRGTTPRRRRAPRVIK